MSFATGGKVGEHNGRVVVSALNNLNFEINDGERVGLIGHNGAGKTTLLRMFSKVYYPTAGKVTVDGDIGSLISISLGINPEFTGRENIYIRGALLGLRKRKSTAKLLKLLISPTWATLSICRYGPILQVCRCGWASASQRSSLRKSC
jgi:lipopolysaccharide transport system ATP-binding protein